MTDVRHVLVAGGGVGGLTLATSLAQRGVRVTLIERRPTFDVPGVGLGQPANALRVYAALGLLGEVLAKGFIYDRMKIFDPARRLIVDHAFRMGDARIPPVCALSRRDLHDILLAAAQQAGVDLRLGTTIATITEDAAAAHVVFADGGSGSYDLVAGFDGVRSMTRRHLVGTAFVPRFSGYGAWRLQVPRHDDVTCMEFLQGIGSKTGAMPLSQASMYVFHIRPEARDAAFSRSDLPALLRERLAPYGSYVAEVAAAANAGSEIVYSPIEPMLLPWPWFKGRVVIGGDAAHVFPPHLTQGAAMAVEDAFVLSRRLLRTDESVAENLMAYSQERYARCAFIHAFSSQWLADEQAVRTPGDLETAKAEMALNASTRIAASDRIIDSFRPDDL